jgi:amino acid adenylation domain-containing protein
MPHTLLANSSNEGKNLTFDPVVSPHDVLLDLWREILGYDSIHADSDFFQLGGDSVRAVQLINTIRSRFQIDATIADIFRFSKLSDFHQRLDKLSPIKLAGQCSAATPSDEIMSSQRTTRSLFQSKSDQIPMYQISVSLHGRVYEEVLVRVWQSLIKIHPRMRTLFQEVEGKIHSKVVDPSSMRHAYRWMEVGSIEESEAATQRWLDESMDPGTGPLIRLLYISGEQDHSRLVLQGHPLVADQASLELLLEELGERYEDSLADHGISEGSSDLNGETESWHFPSQDNDISAEMISRIRQTPRSVRLPYSKTSSGNGSFENQSFRSSFPVSLSSNIQLFANRSGLTVSQVLLAGFAITLQRLSGQELLSIGVPLTRRHFQSTKDQVGPFTTTLPIALDLTDELTFPQLVHQVQDRLVEWLDRPTTTLDLLEDQLPQDAKSEAFFDVVFATEAPFSERHDWAGISAEYVVIPPKISTSSIRLIIESGNSSSSFRLEFNGSMYTQESMRELVSHWEVLLAEATADPERSIHTLPILTTAQHHRIVEEWNATVGDYPAELCMQEFFELQVQRTPDAVALVDSKGNSLTYAELNSRANRLAHWLQAEGIQPSEFVGVCQRRTPEMIISVLGILKAGAAYAPLDANYPQDRLQFMLEDTQASVVLTQIDLLDRLPIGVARLVSIQDVLQQLSTYSTENLPRSNQPDDLAYVIYTSGSTGKPKGVMVRHRPAANILDWVNQTFEVTPSDRVLFVTSLSFDLSVYDIFGILGAGASLRIASDEELRDATQLLHILRSEPITIWDSAPAALQQLLPFFDSEHQGANHDRLRLVMLSGDWIPVTMPDQLRKRFPNVKVKSLGGATEATIWSNWYPIEEVDPRWPSIPYGKPIRNARYHVLNKGLQPQPIGAVGELFIGGPVLADGYLHREELTRERFIDDPFLKQPGAKLYRTGDLARYYQDGNLEFLGRIDHQVKVRGFRVETGEIETVLAQHPLVQDAIVKPFKDAGNHNYLVAFAVANQGQGLVEEVTLVSYLREKLPEYMVPSQLVFLSALPLTPNGKVDRGSLTAPESRKSALPHEEVETDSENIIAEIWKQVLGLKKISRNDHFFELGGHSLLGSQFLARLNQQLSIQLRPMSLFQFPRLNEFAKFVDQNRSVASDTILKPLTRCVEGTDDAPLSLMQSRFWLMHQAISSPEVYNIADVIILKGSLDRTVLQQALQVVVEREPMLRTIFPGQDGIGRQRAFTRYSVNMPLVDLSGLPTQAREEKRSQISAEMGSIRFDLMTTPPWVTRLVRMASEEYYLFFTWHHILVDEKTRSPLFKTWFEIYSDLLLKKVVDRAEVPIRYLDFSSWQREQDLESTWDRSKNYWREKLSGLAPPIVLPGERSREGRTSYRGIWQTFEIPKTIRPKVVELSRRLGVTPFMMFVGIFQTLLARLSNQQDICVGTPLSTRTVPGTETMMGCFINTIPLRNQLDLGRSLEENLIQIRQTILEALDHSDLPFEKLVEALRPERNPGYHPYFQQMFTWQAENDLHGTTPQGLEWHLEAGTQPGVRFDLELIIEERGNEYRGTLAYNTDLYPCETMELLIQRFNTVLLDAVTHPDRPLSDLEIMTEQERYQVIFGWNQTELNYPSLSAAYLVEEQAQKRPDTIAITCDGQKITYGRLNTKANQLAHRLIEMGVKPDTLVGLCVERSIDMVTAALAIWKAGGAYVPLDPDFPPDRLAFYVQDSMMPIIVAHERLLDRLPTVTAKILRIDTESRQLINYPEVTPYSNVAPSNLAYAIYTSGSTGRPNGVMVEHRQLVNFLISMQREPGIVPEDVMLSVTTLSFDIHHLEIWLPLITGSKIVIATRRDGGDGLRLRSVMEANQISIMQATPATYRLLHAAGWEGGPGLKVLCGGEPLQFELAEKLTKEVGEVWNMYGPTETTVWSTIHHVMDAKPPISIGHPIANTQVYVLDETLRPVPIGCTGEIWIAGDGLARGYLNRPELTAKKYLADPFRPEQRMYRTGDLGRWLTNGTLECLGRADHQVKIRGFRIELGEIERVLSEHSQVKNAVVVARRDLSGVDSLHAYVILTRIGVLDAAELRNWLGLRLPDYMVPRSFTSLEQFPLTPNGKIDRKALPEPVIKAVVENEAFALPENDAERALLPIWEEVLNVRPISVTSNFYEMGGHSLLAAILMARIESRLGHRIPLEALFTAPTIRQLGEYLQQRLELGTECMVPFQCRGARPPLYMVAGVGGHVFTFHQFSLLLGPNQPCYGMKAVGIDGTEEPLDDFVAIAQRYAKEILAERQRGPFILSGYSIGGVIAYETAIQLRLLGHEVPMLIIYDVNAPGYPEKGSILKRLALHCIDFFKYDRKHKWDYLSLRFSNLKKKILFRLNKHHLIAPPIPGVRLIPQEHLRRVWGSLHKGYDTYMPKAMFDGKIVLMSSSLEEQWAGVRLNDPYRGWKRWTRGEVELKLIPAAHLELFHSNHIHQLGQMTQSAIDQVTRVASDSGLLNTAVTKEPVHS